MWLASRHRFVVVNLRFAVPPPRGCTVGNLFGGAQAEELKSPDRLVRGRRPTGRGGVGGQQGGSSAGVPRGPRRCAVRPYSLLHSRNTSVAPPPHFVGSGCTAQDSPDALSVVGDGPLRWACAPSGDPPVPFGVIHAGETTREIQNIINESKYIITSTVHAFLCNYPPYPLPLGGINSYYKTLWEAASSIIKISKCNSLQCVGGVVRTN